MTGAGRHVCCPQSRGCGRPAGSGALLLAAGLVVAGAGAAGCAEPRAARVVLVTVDALRHDAFAGSEAGPPSMPRLVERARAGARFDNVYSATPLAQPSLASMLTGLHPWEHGVLGEGCALPRRTTTVAKVLSARGVSTAAVVTARRRWRRLGLLRGFDEVRGDPSRGSPGAVTREALAVLDREGTAGTNAAGRFLWIHYEGPGDRLRSSYEEWAAVVDRELDRLLARLEADAGRFETHVVLTAGHGESFGGTGAGGDAPELDEERIRVPLAILSPRVDPGERRDVAGSVDVAHTLLSLAGVKYPGPRWAGSRDLAAWAPDPSIDPQATSAIRAAAQGMRPATAVPDDRTGRDDARRGAPLFYVVDRRGRLFVGNPCRLIRRPADCEPSAADLARWLFRGMAAATSSGAAG